MTQSSMCSLTFPGVAAMTPAMAGSPDRDETRQLDEAMERYVDGDLAAFDALYAGLSRRVYGYLLSLVRSPHRAEDLLQLVFLKLHSARGAWVRGARVVPYAMAIARNAAFDQLRSPGHRRTHLTHTGELPEQVAPAEEPADAALAERLQQALDQLPPKYREAIVLTKQLEMTSREAGQVVGASETAMKLRVHRGFKLLRQQLADLSPEGWDNDD